MSDNATLFHAECVAMDLGLSLVEDLNTVTHHTGPNGWIGENSQFQRKLMYGTLLWGTLLILRNSWVPVVTKEK